jgi:hypothetical protein
MCPSVVSTSAVQFVVQAVLGTSGLRFGTIQGFMHRGRTGVMVPVTTLPEFPELDGLKTSAVALAVTAFALLLPQILEKNIGRPGRETRTVTKGLLIPEAKERVEQLGDNPLPAAE